MANFSMIRNYFSLFSLYLSSTGSHSCVPWNHHFSDTVFLVKIYSEFLLLRVFFVFGFCSYALLCDTNSKFNIFTAIYEQPLG
ncbi:hypothetical protein ACHQM5_014015 [Ranunculus cassubicifolius]